MNDLIERNKKQEENWSNKMILVFKNKCNILGDIKFYNRSLS